MTNHARQRAEDIKSRLDSMAEDMAVMGQLLVEAYQDHDDKELGYSNWADYCHAEFGTHLLKLKAEVRRVIANDLRAVGATTREIAAATGAKNHSTIVRDFQPPKPTVTRRDPEPPSTPLVPKPPITPSVPIVPDDDDEVIEGEIVEEHGSQVAVPDDVVITYSDETINPIPEAEQAWDKLRKINTALLDLRDYLDSAGITLNGPAAQNTKESFIRLTTAIQEKW